MACGSHSAHCREWLRYRSCAGKTASFGELSQPVDWVKSIGQDDLTTPATKWQVAGNEFAEIECTRNRHGKHKFTSDLKRPGMLYGRVLRAPSFDAKLASR